MSSKIMLLIVVLVLLSGGLWWWQTTLNQDRRPTTDQAPEEKAAGSLASAACQKISLDNLKNYCLALADKDQSYCAKMDDEDKNTCLALVKSDPTLCGNINQPEEKKICYFQISQVSRQINYCDFLTDLNQKENCYFGLVSGLYWEGKSNLITDQMCQKFTAGQPERKTCQALQAGDRNLCGSNSNCLVMFYEDERDCQNFGQVDKRTCLRTVALLTKNSTVCQKIDDQKEKDDCLLDYAGHISPEVAICDQISEDFMRQECYKNVAASLGQ
ncbi:hypothetical protein A2160_01885 [Candidatus Beckwithbacteria bacterium RBG_13_42_9]|uniref:Uncharacterized protein n=1 Tax=Candidatus Beckwithbacteria bacterium RBG_13_42_9 TaxID=1797457 RepID=A0A1F5E867_9BACT|nr:MAG: hypothetical protein A2160_01885 [Candidatus Beckwithbacteria bacterium RBG_13_42_9]